MALAVPRLYPIINCTMPRTNGMAFPQGVLDDLYLQKLHFFPLGHGDLFLSQDLMRRSLSLPLSHRHLIKCFFRCSPEKGLASSIASIDGAHDDTWDFVQTYFQTNRHIHHIPNSIYYIRVMANKYFPGNHDKLLSQ